ncbi:MAG: hypothetical protein HY868_19500 [Chloroflexi bacterium]|nr:hypothetical protein [Chloroflexota bacterium]
MLRAKFAVHSDFLMVLTLFIAFRLLMMVWFSPASVFTGGFLGHEYYFDMARYSEQGYYPFVHFWFEYPPVFPYLAIAVYKLTSLGQANFEYFSRVLTLAVLPFDILTLVNVYRIARRVYDGMSAVRVSWIYALLLLPAYYWWHVPDPILVALTMQSFYWLLAGRNSAAAFALAIAIATKFTPVILVGTACRFIATRQQLFLFTVSLCAIVVLIFGSFFIQSPIFTIASFQALVSVSSWETIWALLDGNFTYGNVGLMPRHFDPAMAAVPVYNPPIVPGWLTLAFFGALFLIVFTRPVDPANPRQVLVFTGVVLMLFLLWSKGWSPQWATLVIPFFLLCYPNWRGLLLSLVLTFVGLLDSLITLSLNNPGMYTLGVIGRTTVFIFVAFDLYAELIHRVPVARANEPTVCVDK